MSIASEITRINTNIASAYTACSNKGATMPVTQNSANLASTIATISGGGGGGNLQTKSVTINSNGTSTVTPDTGYDGLSSVSITSAVTNYVADGYIEYTISSGTWLDTTITLNISTTGKTVNIDHVSIGLPANSSLANTTNVVNARLSVLQKSYNSSNEKITMTVRAEIIPTTALIIAVFGVN